LFNNIFSIENKIFVDGNKINEYKFKIIKNLLETYKSIAKKNNIVGICESVGISSLSGDEAIVAILEKYIKFGSVTSAAYHIYKKNLKNPAACVREANDVIRNRESKVTVEICQVGHSRGFVFEYIHINEIIRERYFDKAVVIQTDDNKLLLASFIPKMRK
jgi:hypothetical protein